MLTAEFIEFVFSAAHIERWNDHARPMRLSELDKQAHKALIAYVLARAEEDRGAALDWCALIDGLIAEFLHRIKLTDIKAPIFHRLMQRQGEAINRWVIQELTPILSPVAQGYWLQALQRHFAPQATPNLERRLLRAAHYLATQWEFRLLYHTAPFLYGIERTKAEIESQIEDHLDLAGVQKIALGKRLHGFVDLVGQLRFQKRWAQTPRVPETSVLGHMLFVAILSYTLVTALGAGTARRRNAFFAALFHDLPEVLTRDIISPVKRGAPGLEALIKAEEARLMEEVLLPLVPTPWHEELRYFTTDEFANRYRDASGTVHRFDTFDDFHRVADRDGQQPVDGQLIKAMDELAALVEAAQSLRHGIRHPALEDCNARLPQKYASQRLGPLDLGQLFAVCRYPEAEAESKNP